LPGELLFSAGPDTELIEDQDQADEKMWFRLDRAKKWRERVRASRRRGRPFKFCAQL